ncbi:MAG: DEAD/DEAH box helicase [Candidatus Aminicenantes bacterium]|nr:DEAD/DEAH box helicase [Candidatus Aminicenantes bacterium]NIM82650.1 DEAD/DEAH box helicase [Candidatus Aminicenantes bacterium]NIN22020.1 DEAD/DEAH box helicase [Candidatus Aminicenantes bacterium]NIN45780.1 DEAD/DEAH box helicase [Candidatus Aminicenantes bacterium]NIN88618.1 DEAD/DEAH box helicase [Candidatus Aminicenantes bacterium]
MTDHKDYKIEQALDDIAKLRGDSASNIQIVRIEKFAGEFREYPENLSPEVKKVYQNKEIDKLYSHQAHAIQEILEGKNVVVSTPTASGKTLIYNTVTLDALTKNPSSRSLYLFPTKALSQDQLAELFDLNKLMGDKLGLFTYDGDTPQSTRKAIRKKAQIVLTNPYMLHSGILPHHTKWVNIFEHLKYVIIDELHYYTGVFGSHMANIIRRLKRICKFYGTDPVFIMSSATISNPKELAEKIIEEEVTLIDRSGAPRGEKYIVFFNPPIVNKELGIRRSYVSVARQISGILLNNGLQVITFANTRLITEVLVKYLKNDFEKNVTDFGKIRGYRGGYLPQKRREIEQGLRRGDIKAVVSTNALELGIDIGSLDAAVLAAYPGTIASTWQRIGRAGRRASKSMGVLVSSSSPVDQFIVNHPEYFTGKSPEMGRINADNLAILVEHIKCAAFELPFVKGEQFGAEDLEEILDYLSEQRILFPNQDKWFWTEQGYPADAVSINRVSSDNFVVVDRTETERVIAEVDFSSALETLHPKAIYMLESEQYVVEEFDYENRKAFVRKSNADYYTDAITYTKIAILDIFEENRKEKYDFFYGDVHVYSQVVGFKKLKFFTNENVGAGDLQLPQQEMHSTAFWVTIKNECLENILISSEEKIEAVSGIAHLMRHICAVMLMCDVKDLGVTVEDNITKSEISRQSIRKVSSLEPGDLLRDFEPNIYIYDSYPNGIGFSEVLFEKGEEIFEKILEAVDRCNCERGCPSCVGPPIRSKDNHKDAAKFIISVLLDRVYH